MKKKDRQGVRTPAGLERKYNIGRATKEAGQAKEMAANASQEVGNADANALEAKRLARDASIDAQKAKQATEDLRKDMEDKVSKKALQTTGAVSIAGENITGTVTLTGEPDEENLYLQAKVAPEEVQVKLLEQAEADEETGDEPADAVEKARGELTHLRLLLQGEHTAFAVNRTEGQQDEETGEITGQGVTVKLEDLITGVALLLAVQAGRVKITGLTDPVEDADAANKAYIDREMAKLREELGLNNGQEGG